ncbi:MAG: hypothetical protein LBH19_10815, partial [Dysgonamonadaceae bacterium]|nr:hypothetical protein [Dysgonamonadaceae bacterium]
MRNLSEKFYNRFIEILKVTIPERGELYKTLEEILCKEKMSIYRRLKGEVPFTFPEIITISHELNISLDEIINITSSYKNLPFTMFFRDYSNLSDAAYKSGEDYVNAIKVAANEPDSEYGYAADILPLPVIVVYPPIFRLFMMKWQYQFGNVNTMLPYSEIVIPERLRSIQREFIQAIQNIKYTYFIYHEFALAKLIHDVQYFKSIRLMTDEDADLLKESLYQALLVLENLSISGTFDTGNKIDMYVSGVSFET